MTRKRTLAPMAAAIAATFCLAMSAPASGQGTASQSTAQGSKSQPHGAAVARNDQAGMNDMRASRLMGTNVRNAEGKGLGEVTDLVVDMSNGRIHYAIVEHGGILGIGDRAVAVPVRRIRAADRGRDVVLDMTEQQLKDAPKLESTVKWSDPRTWDNTGQYYTRTLGMAPSDRPGASSGSGSSTTAGVRFHQASELIGMDLVDRTGDEVGEVEDLVVNLSNGTIHYAVLEFDRAWNPNDKLVALPLSSLQPRQDGKDLTINMTREQLADAPSIDSRNWPEMNDRAFRDRVAGFGRGSTTGMDRSGTSGTQGTTGAATATITTIVIIDEPQFSRLDTDRDGRLSRDEVKAFSRLTENWSLVDSNRDGYLSRAELNNRVSGAGTQASQSGASSGSTASSGTSSRSSPGTASSSGSAR